MSWSKWIITVAACGVLLAADARPARAGGRGGEDEARSITLLYIADLHAQLAPHAEFFWRDRRDSTGMAGGVARIATAVDAIRRDRPGRVLFMDAGDTIQGSAAAAWTEGRAVVGPINALRLDLDIPGNWEVVYGAEALKERAAEFRHPLVAANIREARTGKLLFPPYLVREVGGVRVGVIGFTDPDVPRRQPPGYSKGLIYDGADVIPPLVARLRGEEKVDVVALMTHIGLPKSIRLAETLKGVDFVLSGDTHERTYEPIVRGATWVVEPGSFGSFLGRLDLTVRGGKVVDRKWDLIELRASRFAEDSAVKKVVDETLAPLRPRLDTVIGRTEVPLMRYNVVETNLDDMLSDALREAAGTEIALSNGFRFAPPKPVGPIRESDLWDWFPITTRVKVGKVTGRQLRAFWESEAEHVFSPDAEKLFGGWLPRPSGMTVRLAARAATGRRVLEIRVGGEPLVDDREYTLTACEREGDRPDMLCRIPHVKEARVLDLDAHAAVRRYLARHLPLSAPVGKRVIAEDLPPVVRSQ
ncbi:MAG: bifunctional metallophosphatase/5'-nucleotidase, partial [Isosphaeraceae bacterium]